MKFQKRHIYKKNWILPDLDRDSLIIYGILTILLVSMFVLGLNDSRYYKASLLTAKESSLLVKTAYAKIDSQYILGADVPPGKPPVYDCSSLMVDIYNVIGVDLPRISRDQALIGKAIDLDKVSPGDLLFFDTANAGVVSHVGMVTKRDEDDKIWMVNANSILEKVTEEPVSGKYWRDSFIVAKRINTLTQDVTEEINSDDKSSLSYMPPTELADPRLEDENPEILSQEEVVTDSKSSVQFTDLETDYPFSEAINALASRNILKGTADGKFEPYRALTRAELLKISLKANKTSQAGAKVSFTDIKNHWVEPFVKTAIFNGFVKGYEDNTFKPDKPVTRDEGVKIIIEISKKLSLLDGNKKFSDISDIDWVEKYASIVKEYNLMPLDGNSFEPKKPLSRGEAAQLIYKLSSL